MKRTDKLQTQYGYSKYKEEKPQVKTQSLKWGIIYGIVAVGLLALPSFVLPKCFICSPTMLENLLFIICYLSTTVFGMISILFLHEHNESKINADIKFLKQEKIMKRTEVDSLYKDNWLLTYTTIEELYERIETLAKYGASYTCVFINGINQYHQVYDLLTAEGYSVDHYNGGDNNILEINWG